jgi:transcriptional regulator of acetoin/glycerol metabolism
LLDEFDRAWLEAERSYLERLVAESGGNLAEAVRRSGVRNRNTLISRLKKHGLK